MRIGMFHADEDTSGLAILEYFHRAAKGFPPRHSDPPPRYFEYEVIAYGWPIANWGTVFCEHAGFYWQTGVRPVVAIDLRPIWPAGNLPDPYRPDLTREQAAAICAAGGPCPTTLFYDPYQRYLPVFPLVGHSMLASLFYGLPFYVWFKRREIRRRRLCCVRCGYRLSGLPADAACPECGERTALRVVHPGCPTATRSSV